MYKNPWLYNDQIVGNQKYLEYCANEGYIGFVYIITDLTNNKKYIGKKLWVSKRKLPPLKGKKRKRTQLVETDWREYYGSSNIVKEIVEEHGVKRFKREILHLCKSKGELSYLELKEQVEREVLLYPEEYYNSFIGCKIHRDHIKRLLKNNDDAIC